VVWCVGARTWRLRLVYTTPPPLSIARPSNRSTIYNLALDSLVAAVIPVRPPRASRMSTASIPALGIGDQGINGRASPTYQSNNTTTTPSSRSTLHKSTPSRATRARAIPTPTFLQACATTSRSRRRPRTSASPACARCAAEFVKIAFPASPIFGPRPPPPEGRARHSTLLAGMIFGWSATATILPSSKVCRINRYHRWSSALPYHRSRS